MCPPLRFSCFYCFNTTAPTHVYTLSLHDALPISCLKVSSLVICRRHPVTVLTVGILSFVTQPEMGDRKSTRLNSSHVAISYAVFCLKKKIYQPQPTFQGKELKSCRHNCNPPP